MVVDFAIDFLLVRPGRPRYPVFVHRVAALLHASSRSSLATTPLRVANPSPPSGWIKDFHLQAVDHARDTRAGKAAFAPCPPPRRDRCLLDGGLLDGGHAEPVIGRAFARPVGFATLRAVVRRHERVGWVERSDTHLSPPIRRRWVSRWLNPSYALAIKIPASNDDRLVQLTD